MEIPTSAGDTLNPSYKMMPHIHLATALIWGFSAVAWTIKTYLNRSLQPNRLQWILSSIPWIKTLQFSLSFLFWYSCFYSNICSLWMSFGAYITSIIFHTAAFVSFFLISQGYCITFHHLSLSDRRKIVSLGCFFYYTLVGYKASVPYFTILFVVNYLLVFYIVLGHVSTNIVLLREQLSFIELEQVEVMHNMVYAKYTMFKKFRSAVHAVALLELAILINAFGSLQSYWIRLVIREFAQFFIFIYIGWIFRSQELAPRFTIIPINQPKREPKVLPVCSIEMDAKSFNEFMSYEWHIAVPTPPEKGNSMDSVLVVVRQPHHSFTSPIKS